MMHGPFSLTLSGYVRLVSIMGLVGLVIGCAQTDLLSEERYQQQLRLELRLDRQVYRPGQAVIAQVTLTNAGPTTKTVRAMDAASVRFFFGRTQEETPLLRRPVTSNRASRTDSRVLGPGRRMARRFILTQVTQYRGGLRLQAHYHPLQVETGTPGPLPVVYSEANPYRVEGEVLFKRDSAGLIRREEAIELARQHVGGDVRQADAVLIEDEKGFYKWWVNIKTAAPARDGTDRLRSWFIDPYRGRVWAEASEGFPSSIRDKPSASGR